MQNRILRRSQVEAQIGLSRSSIYQMMSEGEFPLPASAETKRALCV